MSEDQDQDVLNAMRDVWGANTQSAEDLEQFCPTAKVCKNVAELGIQGMGDETTANSLRDEWKRQLKADGKVPDDVQTLAQLIAAQTEPQR